MSWVPGLLGVEISPALMFIFSGAGLDPRSFEGLGFRGCERGKFFVITTIYHKNAPLFWRGAAPGTVFVAGAG